MGVRKDEKRGQWLAEVYNGGKRFRKWFPNKAEAARYYQAMKQKNSPLLQAVAVSKAPVRRLSDLIKQWFDLYGQSLRGGVERCRKLLMITEAMGDPVAKYFTADDFAQYRAQRLRGEIHFKKKNSCDAIKPRTLNYELAAFQAVFNELKRLNRWEGDNPLALLRPLKAPELEFRFLQDEEIARLLSSCEEINPLLKNAVLFCLATGARWGEAMKLTAANVIPYKVTFNRTKGGKNRTVPISTALFNRLDLTNHPIFKGVSDRQFARAVTAADIRLRNNQLTHVLRHTFASHFMMNGGNILVLKEILGHADISMTMIYAHFAPNHLDQAVKFNPVADI